MLGFRHYNNLAIGTNPASLGIILTTNAATQFQQSQN